MRRILAHLSYDGAGFHGYQRQPNDRSVQGEIEQALGKIHKADGWKSVSSGRTDSGVHGIRQPVHFDSSLAIPEDRWPKALNTLLPKDIHVHSCQYVSSSFHARYDALGKEYIYRINTAPERNVFERHYVHHLPKKLDIGAMQEAAAHLTGTHNYTSFSSPKTDVVDKVRTLFVIDIAKEKDDWTLRFTGSGFLYQMVRVLTGTLIEAGAGDRNPGEVPEILAAEDRALAGKTAPACGLYLAQVFYEQKKMDDHIKKFQ
ncbi:tRNA pseudouridine(38-40) synthase TruA [Salipaludibacillus aurantiacus]|uniref:tRNA pseudouridine synthase A n=1 Tax=Salipaludibacillus aurantiacus TaxID=1601833 RepID=A0A1H9V409_9BACI|nr:tRNA pseudouridine(38-40) synthase TruA [Salipaludibacillus aurantiacus]SES16291.1 tRNA pseudouridine38-40 synthase [Salipaludibacillus aurantiacus]